MPAISFNEIPSNTNIPGVYIEIDNTLANNAVEQQEILIIAPKGNSTKVNQIVPTTIPADALAEFGADSLAYKMVATLFKQTNALPISVLVVDATIDTIEDNSADISAALAAVGDKQYHYIVSAFSNTTEQVRLAAFLQERYGAMQQIPGISFSAVRGTTAEVNARAAALNSPFLCLIGVNDLNSRDYPIVIDDTSANTIAYSHIRIAAIVAAAYAGQCAHSLSIDPVRPLQTLKLKGILSTAGTEWTSVERNVMLHGGLSTYRTQPTKDVFVERAITTYTVNANNVADDSYLDIMTVATAMFFRAKQRARILSQYPRHKLAQDGTNFAPGQAVLTPQLFKAAMLGLYRDLEALGIVQDFNNYQATFIANIDADNPTRLNYQDQPVFINGLIIVAGKIQFRKN